MSQANDQRQIPTTEQEQKRATTVQQSTQQESFFGTAHDQKLEASRALSPLINQNSSKMSQDELSQPAWQHPEAGESLLGGKGPALKSSLSDAWSDISVKSSAQEAELGELRTKLDNVLDLLSGLNEKHMAELGRRAGPEITDEQEKQLPGLRTLANVHAQERIPSTGLVNTIIGGLKAMGRGVVDFFKRLTPRAQVMIVATVLTVTTGIPFVDLSQILEVGVKFVFDALDLMLPLASDAVGDMLDILDEIEK